MVAPTGCQHNCLMAEGLDESGGFYPLGITMTQLPLFIPTCKEITAGQVSNARTCWDGPTLITENKPSTNP